MFARYQRAAILLLVASPLLVACGSNTSPGSDQVVYNNDARSRISAGEKFAKDAETRGRTRTPNRGGDSTPTNPPGLGDPPGGSNPPRYQPGLNGQYPSLSMGRSDAWSQVASVGMIGLLAAFMNGSIGKIGEKIVDDTKSLARSVTGVSSSDKADKKESAGQTVVVQPADRGLSGNSLAPSESNSSKESRSSTKSVGVLSLPLQNLVEATAEGAAIKEVVLSSSKTSESQQNQPIHLASGELVITAAPKPAASGSLFGQDPNLDCLLYHAQQATDLSGLSVIFAAAEPEASSR